MKKGFTLIELLAVIIVLAVIALIATPIVLDVVNDARSSTNKSSASMVLSAAKNYYAESIFNNDIKNKLDGKTNLFYDLQVENKPKEGTVYINEEGQVALVLIINNQCYVKAYNSEILEYSKEAPECDISKAIDETKPTIALELIGGEIGNDNWYKNAPFVKITVTDNESGFSSYKWCQGIDCEPNNIETENESSKEITNGEEIQICVIGIDKAGNASEKVCSDLMKVDAVKPTATIAKTTSENQNVLTATIKPLTNESGYTYKWYKDNVEIADATSLEYITSESGLYKIEIITESGNVGYSEEFLINSYTISYDLNGGTESITNTIKVEDINTNITSTIPTRSGYEFVGWGLTASDTTKTYSSGDEYTVNEDLSLYAIWKVSYSCTTGVLTADSTLGADSGGYICVTDGYSYTRCATYGDFLGDVTLDETTYSSYNKCVEYVDDYYDWYYSGWNTCSSVSTPCSRVANSPCTECVIKSSDYIYLYRNSYLEKYSCIDETLYHQRMDRKCKTQETAYACPTGFSTYSGSGTTLKCYSKATLQ